MNRVTKHLTLGFASFALQAATRGNDAKLRFTTPSRRDGRSAGRDLTKGSVGQEVGIDTSFDVAQPSEFSRVSSQHVTTLR